MSPSPPVSSARSWFQFACVALAAVALPALACRSSFLEKYLRLQDPKKHQPPVMKASGGIQDAAGGQARLRQDRPEWVLVGNSMLNCRVDPERLEQVSGHRVFKLSFSATKSAMWYLMIKTIVVPSEVKPKVVSVFFRDRDLSRPALRARFNHDMIERLEGRSFPEWEQVMGHYDDVKKTPWERLSTDTQEGLNWLLPYDRFQEWGRGKVQKIAFNLSALGDPRDYPERREERNEVLSMDHIRASRQGSDEADEAELEKMEALESHFEPRFDPDPDKSFLPHMVALAKQHGFVLHLHRIKTNPDTPLPVDDYVRTLPAYMKDLRTWAESQGCLFTDESEVAEITGGMFVDMVHLKTAPANKDAYMKLFWRQVDPYVNRVMGRVAASSLGDAP